MDLEMFYNFVIDFVVIGDSPRPEICKNLGVHAPLSLRNFVTKISLRSDRRQKTLLRSFKELSNDMHFM